MAAMVDKRWAIAMTVLPSIRRFKLAWMAASTSESKAEVASSGFFIYYFIHYITVSQAAIVASRSS